MLAPSLKCAPLWAWATYNIEENISGVEVTVRLSGEIFHLCSKREHMPFSSTYPSAIARIIRGTLV